MFWLVALIIVLPFALVLLVGAPYLPTRKKQANQALDLLDLKKGDLVVDLGSGDGVVLVQAAKRGLRAVGYELNPLVFALSYLRVLPHRKLVKVRYGNFWNAKLSEDTKGVFVFLLDPYMKKLDQKLAKELQKGTKLVSYTFDIPGKKPIKSHDALNLYRY